MGTLSGTNGKEGKTKKPAAPDFRFLNYNLSAQDKAELLELDLAVELPLTTMLDLVVQGYKFSLSHDAKNECYVAALTDRSPESDYQNCCITGRGQTALDAWYSLAYRHVCVAAGDWSRLGGHEKQATGRFD